MSKRDPMTSFEIAELENFLNDKLNESIGLIRHSNGKRLDYARDTKLFEIHDHIGFVGSSTDLNHAVRLYEAHIARPRPKLQL
jgi:hypothetical protein